MRYKGGNIMEKNLFETLRSDYKNVPLPTELDFVVRSSVKMNMRKKIRNSWIMKMGSIAAGIVLLVGAFTIGLNSNATFAMTMADVPVIGRFAQVLTFKHYVVEEKTYHADIVVPEITDMDNEELASTLNEKYLEESKALYEQFMVDMQDLEAAGGGYMGIDSGVVIKTDNEQLLSIGRYTVNTVGSSSTVFQYDTIDKKNQLLITLKNLFKDDSYIDLISENIKEQMVAEYQADPNRFFWVEGIESEANLQLFDKIKDEQSFYITEDNKLVISFDKYEVAPGYMGVLEFVIPSEILADVLVSDEYIK